MCIKLIFFLNETRFLQDFSLKKIIKIMEAVKFFELISFVTNIIYFRQRLNFSDKKTRLKCFLVFFFPFGRIDLLNKLDVNIISCPVPKKCYRKCSNVWTKLIYLIKIANCCLILRIFLTKPKVLVKSTVFIVCMRRLKWRRRNRRTTKDHVNC